MDSRERISRLLHLEEADRVGFFDTLWRTTTREWRAQGLPAGVFAPSYFGMDITSESVDDSPRFDEVVLDRKDDWRIRRDRYGVKEKAWRRREGVSLYLDPPFRNLEEFEERIEPLLDPESPRRISSKTYPFRAEVGGMFTRLQTNFFVPARILGPFEYARHLCGGTKRTLRYMMTESSMRRRIFRVLGTFLSALSRAYCEAGADAIWVTDNLAFRDGPFFSPELYESTIMPYHRKIVKPFEKQGLPAILSSDGDIRMLIRNVASAGFTALHPLETRAHMDVTHLKDVYGDSFAFIGNISAGRLGTNDIAAIKEEVITKIKAASPGGGYILSSDNSIPPTVELPTFRAFAAMARKYGRYR